SRRGSARLRDDENAQRERPADDYLVNVFVIGDRVGVANFRQEKLPKAVHAFRESDREGAAATIPRRDRPGAEEWESCDLQRHIGSRACKIEDAIGRQIKVKR